MTSPLPSKNALPGIRRTAILCLGLALGMAGLAYASVPLYSLFCRVTGFEGTPLVGTGPSAKVIERTVAVRFDTNVAPGLQWAFAPETGQIAAKLGETQTVFFKVRNTGSTPATGVATYNVQPDLAGSYFVKLECFCFKEQTLQPGETIEFPVVFYVDPGLAQDRDIGDLSEITLSYTYFAAKTPKTTAAVGGVPVSPGTPKSNL